MRQSWEHTDDLILHLEILSDNSVKTIFLIGLNVANHFIHYMYLFIYYLFELI